jgi:magnesium-transporting ATPase (P-type)
VIGVGFGPDREIEWIDGTGILVAVFLVSFVSAANDYSKERKFLKLNAETEEKKRIIVKRDGKDPEPIKLREVVVGDIVEIKAGMEIAGDCIMLESINVQCDEAAVTGETTMMIKEPIEKCVKKRDLLAETGKLLNADIHELPSPILLAGTKIQKGGGWMIVISVGKLSSIGKLEEKLEQDEDSLTPLQLKLEKMAGDIGKFALISALVTLIVLLIRFTVRKVQDGWGDTGDSLGDLLDYILISITIIVVAIPEGLPLAVTLSLAFSISKMIKENNLVRKLYVKNIMGV